MEKYKKFTDPGTGINPFVPFLAHTSNSSAKQTLHIVRLAILSPIIFLIKFILLICFTVTYLLVSTAFSLIPVWFLRRPLERYLNLLCMRAYLFVFGFYHIENSHVNTNNRMQLLSTRDQILGTYMNHGDIIFCNHVSYVELFYLAFRYAPTFTTIVETNDKKREDSRIAVVKNGFISALLNTLDESRTNDIDVSTVLSLAEVVKYCKLNKMGPVVVFPESVTSNGRSILSFQKQIFNDSNLIKVLRDEKIKIHLIGFKFEYQNFSPCYHHTCSPLRHLYGLTTQFYNKLIVRHIHLSETERLQLIAEFYPETVRSYLNSSLRIQPVASARSEKQAFLQYWEKTQNKNYANQEE